MSKLNVEIKFALASLALAVISPIVIVVFALLPIYGLVGKVASESHSDEVLHRSRLLVNLLAPITVLAILAFIVLLVLGLQKVSKNHGR